jgi:glycine cleavage system aminomethyltransferase T
MNINGVELRSDFGDPIAEAKACRNACALFDFTFVRCALVQGKNAQKYVENFASRSLDGLAEGQISYAVRVNGDGNALSDLTIWKTGADSFEVMSGRSEDVADLLRGSNGGSQVTDISDERVALAVQGPLALEVLRDAGAPPEIGALAYFSFLRTVWGNIACIFGRLGYTGEAGFEIIVGREDLSRLRKMIAPYARPAGFIAADMLRIEAGFVLFANEFRLEVSPIEAGLGKFYAGPARSNCELKLVTFRADFGDMRHLPWQPRDKLLRPDAGEITITSACRSAFGKTIIGLGYVPLAAEREAVLRDPEGIFSGISLVHTPFYDEKKRRPRVNWAAQQANSRQQT